MTPEDSARLELRRRLAESSFCTALERELLEERRAHALADARSWSAWSVAVALAALACALQRLWVALALEAAILTVCALLAVRALRRAARARRRPQQLAQR